MPQISIFYLINRIFAAETIQGRKLYEKIRYLKNAKESVSKNYFNVCKQDDWVFATNFFDNSTFRPFGEILQFKLLPQPGPNGVSMGKGFVRYANRFQAVMAIKELNEKKVCWMIFLLNWNNSKLHINTIHLRID